MRITLSFATITAICLSIGGAVVVGCTASQLAKANEATDKIIVATTQPAAVVTTVNSAFPTSAGALVAAILSGLLVVERTVKYTLPYLKKQNDSSDPNGSVGTSVSNSALPTQNPTIPNSLR